MLKLLSFEEFKETRHESLFASDFKDNADGYYSYRIYGGARVYCNWQEEYDNYCERRKMYIERITPLYNLLKANKDKTYSIKELQQILNDNTIKSGTMWSLIKENIVKQTPINITNEKGCCMVINKYQINQTEVES